MPDKTCPQCGESRPASQYYQDRRRKDGLKTYCKSCDKERSTAWRRQNPEKHREWARENRSQFLAGRTQPERRAWHLYQKYRMTLEQFDEMLDAQGGVCAICGTDKPGGKYDIWHVDHDHACCPLGKRVCGKCIRGLLCASCNWGLGRFGDDPERLERAIEYLSKGSLNVLRVS